MPRCSFIVRNTFSVCVLELYSSWTVGRRRQVITCSEICVPDFLDSVSGKIRQRVVGSGYIGWLSSKEQLTGRGHCKICWIDGNLPNFGWVVVTEGYMTIKTDWTAHLKSMHFNGSLIPPKNKISANWKKYS